MIIQQAGPVNLIKTLLILFLVYYAVRFLVKLFAPYLVKKAIDKMQEKAAQHTNSNQNKSTVKDGETVIDKKPQNSKESNNSVGEYVDFEEID